MRADEKPIDPERPIIDPHLHLWEIPEVPGLPQVPQRFLLHEAVKTIAASGHNVTHTVFVECNAMHRADGPRERASLGETEFATGMAAMSANGAYGPARLCHRVVGQVDLRLPDAAAVLDAHRAIAGERFRGIRTNVACSSEGLFGHPCDPALRGVLRDPAFIAGARELARMDLSLDIWCLHPQLADVAALADAVPDLTIVVDHVGTPECSGSWAARGAEAFAEWSRAIGELARRPNVAIKLGGMGMDLHGPLPARPGPASSEQLAEAWRPRVDVAIAAFSPSRAMFESNFPPDQSAGTYGATWNAFKRIARACSDDEKDQLFRRTAAATYRIGI